MASLIKKMKWQTQVALLLLFFGGGYVAWVKELPPFTPEFKEKISGILKRDEDIIKVTGPGQSTRPSKNNIVDPRIGLNNPVLGSPQVKPDENIRKLFTQEIYKQVFTPFNEYPYLFSDDFIRSANNSGLLKAIQFGNVPASAVNDQAYRDYCEFFTQTYGFSPPGGGCSNLPDSIYFDPFDPDISFGDVPTGSSLPTGSPNPGRCSALYNGTCAATCINGPTIQCLDCINSCGSGSLSNLAKSYYTIGGMIK